MENQTGPRFENPQDYQCVQSYMQWKTEGEAAIESDEGAVQLGYQRTRQSERGTVHGETKNQLNGVWWRKVYCTRYRQSTAEEE